MVEVVDKTLDFQLGGPSEVMVWGGWCITVVAFHFQGFASVFFPNTQI